MIRKLKVIIIRYWKELILNAKIKRYKIKRKFSELHMWN